jgi:hypothetical protein
LGKRGDGGLTGAWIVDFVKRLKQAQELARLAMEPRRNTVQVGGGGVHPSNAEALLTFGVGASVCAPQELWLGGLFFPEAFITAARQQTAQRHKCSLQELQLVMDLDPARGQDESFVGVKGLVLEGASWEDGEVKLTSVIRCPLPLAYLGWVSRRVGDLLGGMGPEGSA